MYDFTYRRAGSLDEAKRLIAEEDGQALSGGQTLMPVLRARLAMPSMLVDLSRLDELKGVSMEGDRIVILGATTHAEVAGDAIVREHCPALAELAGGIGDPQVRHRGTIGGSVANNDPAACYPSACLALDAEIRTERRTIAAADFFTSMFETALEPGEIVTAVTFPACREARYEKFPNPASRFALIAVFAARLGDRVQLAVTGGGTGVFRWRSGEDAAQDDGDLSSASLEAAHFTGDLHASTEYRIHLTRVMAQRALTAIG
ncbi:FAD binding domain-containing protein [Paraurantiacibacter namhicola]|uniref:6-hydroxypseudooxynicotine dehydrogenase complex subunit alpha n=1 Tax=Paraurantiacibacter namhicola TaxID=645517 RepID=A0A1C7DAF3_9SPHN|nr:xanthine dehydrogenase family protein subunit M [Paraurantiacibacter namhicola]ANU08428.1 6-hydroxypseudooxynicotine dehydrogenase complex subunit alpha [Paraurantiacibacter namhicola]